MDSVTIQIADADLSDLVARVEAGTEVVLARNETPVVKLVPADPPPPPKPIRRFGSMKGQFTVPDSFFDPLPEEELALWE